MAGYSQAEAARLTRATVNQLRYWQQIGLLGSDVNSSPHRGPPQRYLTLRDVVTARVIMSLLDNGMTL